MIPFTQFLRPNGRRRDITIERPPEVAKKAEALLRSGCRFEIEELTTGHVSMEVMYKDECISSSLCLNGPNVPLTIDNLVEDAYNRMAHRKETV